MSPLPFVSVIIPACNAEAVLAEALGSVRHQSFPNYEVLIVDDGSTDRTGEVAQRFAGADPRFRLFQQANGGCPAARNTALRQARGEWIAFLDADDVWLPTKLERQFQLLEDDPKANFLFANYYVWNGRVDLIPRYSRRSKFPEGEVLHRLRDWNVFGTSTVVVQRQTLERVGHFDPELQNGQDWDLWLRIAEAGLRARGVWEPQARYRIWPGNITANKVRTTNYAVRLFEKALARPQPPGRLRHYQRSLRMARAFAELARAQSLLEHRPAEVPPAVLRAWKFYPPHIKWLWRYLGLVWPSALGGSWMAKTMRRKLKAWRMGKRLEVCPLESKGPVSDRGNLAGAGRRSCTIPEPF